MNRTFGFVVFAAAFAFASSSTGASAADFSGRWATKTSGEMRLEQNGARVDGTYALNNGRIRGEVNGDRLTGLWVQSTSGRRCTSEQQGTYYWGRLTVSLSSDGRGWSGRWSYCDEADGSGGEWAADRVGDVAYHDGLLPNRWFEGRWSTKTSGEMRLKQNGAHISGTYALNNGRIEGEVDGKRLTGLWAQSNSGRRCNTQQLGSFYWGRFSFQLNGDGEGWSGPWSYCDEANGSGGTWEATRIGE